MWLFIFPRILLGSYDLVCELTAHKIVIHETRLSLLAAAEVYHKHDSLAMCDDRENCEYSGMLRSFPHVENSCEINPSHMVFMIFTLCEIYIYISHDRRTLIENAFCIVHVRLIFSPLISESQSSRLWIPHGQPYQMHIVILIHFTVNFKNLQMRYMSQPIRRVGIK